MVYGDFWEACGCGLTGLLLKWVPNDWLVAEVGANVGFLSVHRVRVFITGPVGDAFILMLGR
jgi:hypothetical protein